VGQKEIQENYELCDRYMHTAVTSLNELIKIKRGKNQYCVHLVRYLAKISLQYCAVKSELEQHEDAHRLAMESFMNCVESIIMSYKMCKAEAGKLNPVAERGGGNNEGSAQ
jgi:hypothetical protein